MKIDCISDLHGEQPELEGGDLLIVAGDLTISDKVKEWKTFFEWLDKQNYTKKILIAGNHDNFCTNWAVSNDSIYEILPEEKPNFDYLFDTGTEFEGLKIWGSPWTKTFPGMNPHCMAFTVDTEEELSKKWELIPHDIDILITHCPPYGILDEARIIKFSGQRKETHHTGSKSLRNHILDGSKFKNLKLHVFGHIHEQGGKTFNTSLTKFVNASILNEDYFPVNNPIRVIL